MNATITKHEIELDAFGMDRDILRLRPHGYGDTHRPEAGMLALTSAAKTAKEDSSDEDIYADMPTLESSDDDMPALAPSSSDDDMPDLESSSESGSSDTPPILKKIGVSYIRKR